MLLPQFGGRFYATDPQLMPQSHCECPQVSKDLYKVSDRSHAPECCQPNPPPPRLKARS